MGCYRSRPIETTHNRTNISTVPNPNFISFPCIFLLVLRSFLFLQGNDPRGPRGDQVDLGQPIAAVLPDGVPPGSAGFRVFKSVRRLSCVSRYWTDLLRRELRCITPGVEGTGDVFVCQQDDREHGVDESGTVLVNLP